MQLSGHTSKSLKNTFNAPLAPFFQSFGLTKRLQAELHSEHQTIYIIFVVMTEQKCWEFVKWRLDPSMMLRTRLASAGFGVVVVLQATGSHRADKKVWGNREEEQAREVDSEKLWLRRIHEGPRFHTNSVSATSRNSPSWFVTYGRNFEENPNPSSYFFRRLI